MMLSSCCASVLAVVALATACGTADGSQATTSATPADGRVYVRALVQDCLAKRGVSSSSAPSSVMRSYIRRVKALTGGINIRPTPFLGLPGPPMDAGNVLFLRSSSDAQHDENTLADTFVFHKGEPDSVRAVFPPPPTKKAAQSVQRVARNVLIFWQWPRRHPASSDRIVNACLAHALR
jgi:hypothetical protein